jgi:hypothetical protein
MPLSVIVAAATFLSAALAADATPRANTNIVRWAAGTMAYRVQSTGAVNGHERWRLSVHPDGSRTMAATVAYAPRPVERQVIHRVDRNWAPLETYTTLWFEGAWRGSAMLTARDGRLRVVGNGPGGAAEQDLPARERLAVLPHLIAVDSWRAFLFDKRVGGEQAIPSYDFNATGDGDKGVIGAMKSFRLRYLGAAEVDVPAGRFTADHFRIEDAVDIYLTGKDGVVVKFVFAGIDREHHLIEYGEGP